MFAAAAKREASARLPPEPDIPKPAPEPTEFTGHAVLVGYGRVGKLIAQGVKGMPLTVVEEGAVDDPGVEHIRSNAARDDLLAVTNMAGALLPFVVIPVAFEAGQIVQEVRGINPHLTIIARAHFDAEVERLLTLGASQV